MVGTVLAVDEDELDELDELLLVELLDELVAELLDELVLVDELLDELTLLSSQRFVAPGSGSTKYVVLQRMPPLTASTSMTVHEVLRPKRTLRLPVNAHKSPSFAQKVQVSVAAEELELLVELLLEELDELETELDELELEETELEELELDVLETTWMLKAGSERLALPSLTLITMFV